MDKLIIDQLPVENLRGKRVFVRIDVDTQHANDMKRILNFERILCRSQVPNRPGRWVA